METQFKKQLSTYLSAKTRSIIADGISALFILLFIYTATSKIFTFKDFSNVLYVVPVIHSLPGTAAVSVIAVQIIVGLLLIIPFTQKTGLYATVLLLLIFTVYLIYMVNFVDILPCNCGGVSSYLSWENHIWFNTILIFLACSGILTNQSYKKQQS